ncbi:RNA-directed DNA polymerase, eukaryota [Tanacetum coccineum]
MSSNVRGGSKDSNASLLERLSCNIFITNLPSHLTAKELWKTCGMYGTVLDVYIPKKLSKQGNLVLVECIKDFKTFPNFHNVCSSEGFKGVTVSYLGCYWVLLEFESTQSCEKFQKLSDVEGIPLQAWSHSTFNKISCKEGELVYTDDSNASNKYSIRLCVKTRLHQLITESFKVVLRGEISVVRAKEITGWVLEFGREDEKQFEEQSEADKLSLQEEDEDDKVVPGAFQHDANIHVVKPSDHTAKSYGDPFGLE